MILVKVLDTITVGMTVLTMIPTFMYVMICLTSKKGRLSPHLPNIQ